MTPLEYRRRVVVGAFVTGACVLLLASIVLLGRSQSLFRHKTQLHASFENTSGLVVGAPVRLAGVDVGVVESIRFSADPHVKTVHVTLGVESRYLDRVREDSIARLSSKGLLGDTIIDITVGSVEARPLANGATLQAEESVGLNEVVTSMQSTMEGLRTVANTVDERVRATFSDELAGDVQRLARSAANMANSIEHGPGVLHALLYDPRLARDVTLSVADARRIVHGGADAIERLDNVVAAVEHGPGTLHQLVYGEDLSKLVSESERAVGGLNDIIGRIEHGRGLAHSLVYADEDQRNLVENLTELSRILRQLGQEMQQGKGTIGALVKDPSVYEDLKTILGNVKRNKLLRSLIRYTIVKDDLSR